MAKLTLVKQGGAPGKGTNVIRIYASTYNKICELSEETGMTIPQLASKLIDFALENTVVIDEVSED